MPITDDFVGTKLAAALVGVDASLVNRRQVPTPRTTDGEAIFSTLATLIDDVLADARVAPMGVGVGCGGPMTPGGAAVSPTNIGAWRSFPLRDRVAHHTGLDTVVDNDAKAYARGEGWKGAAAGSRNYLAMVVSTGVGGGIVLDGRLLDGQQSNAGHVGHLIVEPDGRRCGCGAHGCLEAEASGTAIAVITGRPAAEASPEVVERTGRLVGRAVGSVANLLDLRLAVVAGSVALGFGEPFFAAAQAEVDAVAQLDFARGTRIIPGGLGADGPLVGAGALAWSHLGRLEGP
jgi:glucokinase